MVVGTEAARQETLPNKPFRLWEILVGGILPAISTLLVTGWWVFRVQVWDGPVAAVVFFVGSTTLAFATWPRGGSGTIRAFRAGWLRATYSLGLGLGLALPIAMLAFAVWGVFAGLMAKGLTLYAIATLSIMQAILFIGILARLLAFPNLDNLPRTPMMLGTVMPFIVSFALFVS